MEEANKEEIEGLRRCVQMHTFKSNVVTIEEMLSWVRSVRFFQKKVSKKKSEHVDIRNMLNRIVNWELNCY